MDPQAAPQPQAGPMPMPAQPPQGQQAQAAQQLPEGSPTTIDGVMRLFRDKALQQFRIDVETDSTIAGDESQEKQDRQQLISGLVKLIEVSGPIVAAQPIMLPLMGELMKFGIRAFRVGRPLEQIVDETIDRLEEASQQPKAPPQPSPDEMIKLQGTQAKVQAEIQKAQIAVQQAQVDAQGKILSHQGDMAALQMDHQANQQQSATNAALAQQKANNEQASMQMKNQLEEMKYQRAIKQQSLAPDKGN